MKSAIFNCWLAPRLFASVLLPWLQLALLSVFHFSNKYSHHSQWAKKSKWLWVGYPRKFIGKIWKCVGHIPLDTVTVCYNWVNVEFLTQKNQTFRKTWQKGHENTHTIVSLNAMDLTALAVSDCKDYTNNCSQLLLSWCQSATSFTLTYSG